MKLGICCTEKRFEKAAACGFSYVDIPLINVRDLDHDALMAMRSKAESLGMPIETACCFFNSKVTLYGDEASKKEILAYSLHNFEVANTLGVSICVIGSGKVRSVPEGMDRSKAEEWFADLLRRLGDQASNFGIRLALEPLCHAETNFVNTVMDGIQLSRKVDHPNIGCLVDFYHCFSNGEDLSDLNNFRPGELIHAHLARPNEDRGAPRAEDVPVLTAWADKLREIGYDQRLTLECLWKDETENTMADAVAAMSVFCR